MVSGWPVGTSALPSIRIAREPVVGADVQVVVVPEDAGAVEAGAEALLLFEAAVAVGVAQRDDRTGGPPSTARRSMT